MQNAMFSCVSETFYGKQEVFIIYIYNINIYLKPQESSEDRWFCNVNNVMSLYDLYDILSGFFVYLKQI